MAVCYTKYLNVNIYLDYYHLECVLGKRITCEQFLIRSTGVQHFNIIDTEAAGALLCDQMLVQDKSEKWLAIIVRPHHPKHLNANIQLSEIAYRFAEKILRIIFGQITIDFSRATTFQSNSNWFLAIFIVVFSILFCLTIRIRQNWPFFRISNRRIANNQIEQTLKLLQTKLLRT